MNEGTIFCYIHDYAINIRICDQIILLPKLAGKMSKLECPRQQAGRVGWADNSVTCVETNTSVSSAHVIFY